MRTSENSCSTTLMDKTRLYSCSEPFDRTLDQVVTQGGVWGGNEPHSYFIAFQTLIGNLAPSAPYSSSGSRIVVCPCSVMIHSGSPPSEFIG